MSTLRALPTSHIQQANWFLYKFDPTGLSDKISIALRIKSPIDIPTVKNALQALTERHPILRSLYSEHNQEIIQEVRENVEIEFQSINASSWNEQELNQELLKRAKSPFYLETGTVFRAILLSRTVAENIL